MNTEPDTSRCLHSVDGMSGPPCRTVAMSRYKARIPYREPTDEAITKSPKDQPDSDPVNAGIRTEPELPIHEDIAPPPKQSTNEFEFDRDEQSDDDVARGRRLQDRMRGNAQQASLDPGDGIAL